MDKHFEEAAKQKVIDQMAALDKFEGAMIAIADLYRRKGGLFAAVCAVLDACRDYVPAAQGIFEDFSTAASGYASGKHKTLDDAFGESRPSHWRQDKRNFELEHGFEIVELVNDLCNAGAVKPDVFYTVGEKFHKDGGVIKGIYYSSRKVRQRYNEEVKSNNEVVRRTSNMWSLKLHLEGVYEAVGLLLAHDMCLEDALAAVAEAAEEDVAYVRESYERAIKNVRELQSEVGRE